jgi:hypothetical protein
VVQLKSLYKFLSKKGFTKKVFILDNYVISGHTAGVYSIFSPIQKSTERTFFDQFFGLSYKGTQSTVRIVARQISPTVVMEDFATATADDSWNYYSKNVSKILFLNAAWKAGTVVEWQVM